MAMFSIILSPGAILLSILNFIDAHMLVIDDIKLIFVLVDLKLYRTRNALNYFLVTNPMGVAPTPDKKPSRFVSVVVSDWPDSGSPGPRPGPATVRQLVHYKYVGGRASPGLCDDRRNTTHVLVFCLVTSSSISQEYCSFVV